MKTRIFTLILLLGSTPIFAQQPWRTNGNTIGTTNFLGTNNNQPLRIHTNGTERLRITPTDRIFAFRNISGLLINPANPAKFEINDRNTTFANTENFTLLRVRGRGFNTGDDPNGFVNNYTLADFIQSRTSTADAGIRIQGSRAFATETRFEQTPFNQLI